MQFSHNGTFKILVLFFYVKSRERRFFLGVQRRSTTKQYVTQLQKVRHKNKAWILKIFVRLHIYGRMQHFQVKCPSDMHSKNPY